MSSPVENRADNAAKAAFGVSPTPEPDMGAEAIQPRGNEGRKVKHCCVSVGSYQLAVARAFMHSFHSEASLLTTVSGV